MRSSDRRQLIDITPQVIGFVEESGIRNGVCVVSVPHATAAVIVNEHETGLMQDMLGKVEDVFPISRSYRHNAIDDNADAHLAAAFLGHSRMFPIADGRVVRGTWQNVFIFELDGPRSRREIWLQAIGDT